MGGERDILRVRSGREVHMMTRSALFVGVFLAAGSCLAQVASMKVGEEIRYPTRYQTQQVGDYVSTGRADPRQVRPPVPSSFQTRETGARMTVSDMPVATAVRYVLPPGKSACTVRFSDGVVAQFVNGWITHKDGVPYRGIRLVNGRYYARNLRTGEVVAFGPRK